MATDDKAKTVGELAAFVGAEVRGDASRKVTGLGPIDDAGPGDLTFIASAKYARAFRESEATAVIIDKKTIEEMDEVGEVGEGPGDEGPALLIVKEPYVAFAMILGEFRPAYKPAPGIHPSAVIDKTATIAKGVHVGPSAVICEGVTVGEGAAVFAGVYLGPGVSVGEGTVLYPNVSVREGSVIGKNVIIHCNSVIGADGFGFAKQESGSYRKIPQTGTVRICDDVEIGACSTVDRATLGETVIGRGTKIDNLVQVAHNCRIGEDTIFVAQSGVAGSTTVGSRVTVAGQSAITGHIEITDDVTIGPRSGVSKSISKKGVYTGYPAQPHKDWLKGVVIAGKLPELKKRVDELEKKIKELEKKKG